MSAYGRVVKQAITRSDGAVRRANFRTEKVMPTGDVHCVGRPEGEEQEDDKTVFKSGC